MKWRNSLYFLVCNVKVSLQKSTWVYRLWACLKVQSATFFAVPTKTALHHTLWSYSSTFYPAQCHTEKLMLSYPYFGEGNGTPLQYSCLENPRDGGAWWAAISGITQSRTQLRQLSSSSSNSVICYLITYFVPLFCPYQ